MIDSTHTPTFFKVRKLCGISVSPAIPDVESASPLPPLQRRRLSELGRAAIDVAAHISKDTSASSPLVFASRYGDMDRSVVLLSQLGDAEGLSPTQFGLSVHNAVGAFFSIANKHVGNYTSVAAGNETTAAAFCEALAFLATGHEEVRIVCYDAPLPEAYAQYETQTHQPLHAWGCVLTKASGAGFSLRSEPALAQAPNHDEADSLSVLRFLNGSDPSYQYRGTRCIWHWQRHD